MNHDGASGTGAVSLFGIFFRNTYGLSPSAVVLCIHVYRRCQHATTFDVMPTTPTLNTYAALRFFVAPLPKIPGPTKWRLLCQAWDLLSAFMSLCAPGTSSVRLSSLS